jgi:AcrR family transcriptional regulator
VPKIAANTIAENRDLREAAILSAANSIAREQGLAQVTFSAIAKKTGIARTTVYAYFDSSADLIADVLIDELFEMNELLSHRVQSAATPREGVTSWISASLEYVNDGRHELLKSAASVELPPVRRAQMQQLHRAMISPLVDALSNLKVDQPQTVAMQISGVVDVAVRRLASGGDLNQEIAATNAFVLNGLAAFTDAR